MSFGYLESKRVYGVNLVRVTKVKSGECIILFCFFACCSFSCKQLDVNFLM